MWNIFFHRLHKRYGVRMNNKSPPTGSASNGGRFIYDCLIHASPVDEEFVRQTIVTRWAQIPHCQIWLIHKWHYANFDIIQPPPPLSHCTLKWLSYSWLHTKCCTTTWQQWAHIIKPVRYLYLYPEIVIFMATSW